LSSVRQWGSQTPTGRSVCGTAGSSLYYGGRRVGRFDAARARLDEAGEITIALGRDATVFALVGVELLAWHGPETEARSAVAAVTEVAAKRGINGFLNNALLAAGPRRATSARVTPCG
jgi:hypothetical protein